MAWDRFVGVMRPFSLLFKAALMASTSFICTADLDWADEACMSKVGLPERVTDSFEAPVNGRRNGSPLSSLARTDARLPFIMWPSSRTMW